jgi:homoserine O-succinyltransferase/O-acetyltransferase
MLSTDDESQRNSIHIGLVNNMPDSAFGATERQFLTLLEAAAGNLEIRVTFYVIPEIPRSDSGKRYASSYRPISDLWDSRMDGLIVSGTEPRVANLEAEPYWRSLIQLIDWADSNTTSSVWSCLAAHAAALHLDGIRRRKLDVKRFGIFECSLGDTNRLTNGVSPCMRMPHSRWNDLPEDALSSSGYRVLMRSSAGVDAFAKQRKSLFVCFQGHPEYEEDTLLKEYRRDVKRYLTCESDTYPTMPHGYFDEQEMAACLALQERAMFDRRPEISADFPVVGSVRNTWKLAATRIYRNWLSHLAEQQPRLTRKAQATTV